MLPIKVERLRRDIILVMSRFQTFSPIVDQDEEGEGLGPEEKVPEEGDEDKELETESSTDDEEI